MKILAVGMNYALHNKELNNSLLLSDPVIFSKPDSALLRDGRPFFIPDWADRFEYETEVVVRICHVGKSISERFAHRYYDAVTVGIDFTARDVQEKLRKDGLPWELCKAFDGSAAIGEFIKKEELGDLNNLDFHLDIDDRTVQSGNTRDMMFCIDRIIAYASQFFTLKTGDLIFTGTPAGVGPVNENQRLKGYLQDKKVLEFNIK